MLNVERLKDFARRSRLNTIRLLKDKGAFGKDYLTTVKIILETQYPKRHMIRFDNPIAFDPQPESCTDQWNNSTHIIGITLLCDQILIMTTGMMSNIIGKIDKFPYTITKSMYQQIIKCLINRDTIDMYNFNECCQVEYSYDSMRLDTIVHNTAYNFPNLVNTDRLDYIVLDLWLL